jgi:hypothetical protein
MMDRFDLRIEVPQSAYDRTRPAALGRKLGHGRRTGGGGARHPGAALRAHPQARVNADARAGCWRKSRRSTANAGRCWRWRPKSWA